MLDPALLNGVLPVKTLMRVAARWTPATGRQRALPVIVVVWMGLAMHLYPHESLRNVWRRLTHSRRLLQPMPCELSASAICQARQRVGAGPFVQLFHELARPVARRDRHPAAFYHRYRLVALDGTYENVADTTALSQTFGRQSGKRGDAGYPQLQLLLLIECGTHVVLEAGVWPCHAGEAPHGRRLLRGLTSSMLLLADANFYSGAMLRTVRATGARYLGRVSSTPLLRPVRILADGSYEALVLAQAGTPIRVRVLEYVLNDPVRDPTGDRQRLVTTLLDPVAHPALDLIALYHERWEIEISIDEFDTHLRQCQRTWRSRTVPGVVQEVYSLLIVYNAVRMLVAQAAADAHIAADQVSFTDGLQEVLRFLPDLGRATPCQRRHWTTRLLAAIGSHRLPPRRDRINPRVVKCPQSKFPAKHAVHRHPPHPAGPFRDCIQLILVPGGTA